MRPTAIVVDHSPIIATQIADCLTKAGFDVVDICYDGIAGAAAARAQSPDVVTFDLLLPRLSGLQMVAAVKRFHTNVSLVAITSVTSRDRVAEVKRHGVQYYVLKAVDPERLHMVGRRIAEQLQETPAVIVG